MYYLANVNHNSMTAHHTRSERRVLRSAVYPMQWTGLMVVRCGMAVKRMGC